MGFGRESIYETVNTLTIGEPPGMGLLGIIRCTPLVRPHPSLKAAATISRPTTIMVKRLFDKGEGAITVYHVHRVRKNKKECGSMLR